MANEKRTARMLFSLGEGRAMLQGSRILLRAYTRQDLARQCQFNNNVETYVLGSNCPPTPQSLESLEAEFEANLRQEQPSFAIEVDGVLIGGCALTTFDEIARTCALLVNIGDPDYRGQGYGRDAVCTLLDYAFRLRNQRKVWLTVFGHNERAIRCYQACGFVEEGRLKEHVWSDGKYVDVLYMAVFRDTWQRPTFP